MNDAYSTDPDVVRALLQTDDGIDRVQEALAESILLDLQFESGPIVAALFAELRAVRAACADLRGQQEGLR